MGKIDQREHSEPAESSGRATERTMALIEPIVYADIFDFPLTLEELHRYCRLPIAKEALQVELETTADLDRVIERVDGYYCLRGRGRLAALRRRRQAASEQAWRHARRMVRLVKYVPFVRGVLVTGSLAVDNVRQADDVDFLVVVRAGRIWTVFLALGGLQRLGLERVLCVNYYLSQDHLQLARQTAYVAREMLQARPAAGAEACGRFVAANRWAHALFPNSSPSAPQAAGAAGVDERRGLSAKLVSLAERALGGRAGDRLEALLSRALRHRLSVHYADRGKDVPTDVLQRALAGEELRFHGNEHEHRAAAQLRARLSELRRTLEDGST